MLNYCYFLFTAVLPLWALQLKRLDNNLMLAPAHVPYDAIVLQFLLVLCIFGLGVLVRRARSNVGRIFNKVARPLGFITLILTITFNIYNISDLLVLIDWKTALFSCLQPTAIVIFCIIAGITGKFQAKNIKSLGSFLLIKGSLTTFLTLRGGLEQPELENAIAASCLLSLVSACLLFICCVCQCVSSRCYGRQFEPGMHELITEVEDSEESEDIEDKKRCTAEEKEQKVYDYQQASAMGGGWTLPGIWVWI